jgi:hypothetical protein
MSRRRKPRKPPFRVDGVRKNFADPTHRRSASVRRRAAFSAFFDAIGEHGLDAVMAKRGKAMPPK